MAGLYDMVKNTQNHSNDNKTLTENGAVTYAGFGDKLIDLNNAVMTLRNKSDNEVKRLFEEVYNEDPKSAVKWLFQVGDIREGKGERRTFNLGMDFLSENHPDVAIQMIPLIPEYARYDYATRLIRSDNKEVADAALKFTVDQVKADRDALKNNGSPSLLAKWLPSIQTKDKEERKIAFAIEKTMGLDHKQYRKMLSEIRDHLNIIEKNLSTHTMDKVNFEHLTSHQNLKFSEAFQRHCPEERKDYLQKVMAGEAKMNAGVVYPYEIIHRYRAGSYGSYALKTQQYNMDLEAMWKMLPDKVKGDNSTIVIRDGSGSMMSSINSNTTATCLEVATALAIYFAEHQSGDMKDKYITFSANPEVVDMSHLTTLKEKIDLSYQQTDCTNTNMEKTCQLLLDTFKQNHIPNDEIPKNMLIVSDMEFDEATRPRRNLWSSRYQNEQEASSYDGWTDTLFESIQKQWKEEGYELPRLIFWQVNANRALAPVIDNDRGLIVLSGFSTNTLDMVLSGDFEKTVIDRETGEEKKVTLTPQEQLEKILAQERYNAVEEAFDRGVMSERQYHPERIVEQKERDRNEMYAEKDERLSSSIGSQFDFQKMLDDTFDDYDDEELGRTR